MVELNQVLSSLKYSVKKVIQSEINLISAKIDSLKDLTVVNTDNVMPWSEEKNIIYSAEQTSPNTGN